MPYLPSDINTFYDVFGGALNVGINVECNKVIYNEIIDYVVDIFRSIKGKSKEECLSLIYGVMNKYELGGENGQEGFLRLREDYNGGNREWYMFYVLSCYSFNYQYRFNKNRDYNGSYGKNICKFSNAMESRFISMLEKLNDIDIDFYNLDFRDMDYSNATKEDLVYCDPPYLISTAMYNDGRRGFKGWDNNSEHDLLDLLNDLDSNGVRFALSNVFYHKGLENTLLIEWAKKYNVNFLNSHYGNRCFTAEEKGKTVEVLITNF